MEKKQSCGCCGGNKLIFACSGAADVGAVADRVARKLNKNGNGKMFCTVGIGGRVPGIMKTTEAADKVLAIDGCPLNCVERCLNEAGFREFEHLQLADLGMEKGKTEVSEKNTCGAAAEGAELLV